jgi:next-to-BRCA1 protein 1
MPTMGDLQSKTRSTGTETSSVPSSNAATQVQTVADLKPSEDVSKKVEGSKEKLESANAEDYQAHFVCDIVPDGVALPTNTTFKQVWTLVNVGSVPWPVGCCVKFVGGDNMRNIDPDHPFSIFDLEQTAETINTDKEVLPGQEFDFAITLRTAKHLGKSISYWRLTGPDGHKFGHKLWCEVNVCDMSTSDIPNSELPSTPKSITTTEPNATQPMQPTVSEQSQEKLIDFEEPQPNLQGSEMIFPKLDRESPVSSQQNVAEDTTPLGEADDLLVDDVASLKIDEDSSEDGFLTDEEYDILNASDEEFLQEAQKAAHP